MDTTEAHRLFRAQEELQIIVEALTQFVDNQPDVDEPDPRDLHKAEVARNLLELKEAQLIALLDVVRNKRE